MTKFGKLAHIFGVEEDFIVALDRAMAKATSRRGVAEYLVDSIEETITRTLGKLGINSDCGADEVREVLREAIFTHEHQFLDFLNGVQGATEFEKAMNLARKIAKVGNGFFLKKDRAQKILEERPPMNLIKFFGYSNVQELLKKQDITESFSALRFIESNEWMHETFDKVYSNFTVHDFEERPIELRVLGSEWLEVSKKFVAKKHHNVSHLKEFGVIFLNPIREDMPGKFLRDFALLLHYFHEIEFYAKLFRRYSQDEDFAVKFKSFLRGDVQERNVVSEGEWLIVQRYLWKENPDDLRLKLPRVNPESMHWARGERDLARFGLDHASIDLELWKDLDWVGDLLRNGDKPALVSFDLEDNAMSEVSFREGREEFFTYHQREALWTKFFEMYVGGEEQMEKLLIENFSKGSIIFK